MIELLILLVVFLFVVYMNERDKTQKILRENIALLEEIYRLRVERFNNEKGRLLNKKSD